MVNYLWTSQECIVKVPLAFLQIVFEILIFLLGIVGAIFWCRKELMFKGLVIMYICVFIYINVCLYVHVGYFVVSESWFGPSERTVLN